MSLNVAIGFVTGRKHFQHLLTSYVNNWLEHGLIIDKNIRLHLFVAYDLKYMKTRPGDYKDIKPEVAQMIDSINFYGKPAIEKEKKDIVDSGILNQKEVDTLFGDGYARKRNALVYFAIKNNMDRLIFIDDDEYPVGVMQNKYDHLVWMGQSVVGAHLRYSADADITHGFHCGYISPIPFIQFNDIITESVFRKFITAISNEIITWKSVKRNIIRNHGITYADSGIINKQKVSETKEQYGMKFISGANLCFNLENCRDKLPPFYNPPGARGEDTFMSTALSDLKVIKAPVYTFHDGFLHYRHILRGILPVTLHPVDAASPGVLKRFVAASIGWIRYKPLMIFVTRPKAYRDIIEQVRADLKIAVPLFCKYFNTDQFYQIEEELEFYHKNVQKHFDSFSATKEAWKKLINQVTVN